MIQINEKSKNEKDFIVVIAGNFHHLNYSLNFSKYFHIIVVVVEERIVKRSIFSELQRVLNKSAPKSKKYG